MNDFFCENVYFETIMNILLYRQSLKIQVANEEVANMTSNITWHDI